MIGPIAIIMISTDGHAQYLSPCLNSIYSHCREIVQRIIVVDNDGLGASTSVAAGWQEKLPLQILNQKTRKGFAANFNDAFSLTTEPFILLLNVDTELAYDVITPALRTLETHAAVCALTVKMKGYDGSLQSAARAFPTPGILFWEQIGVARLFPESRLLGRYRLYYSSQKTAREVDWISGAFMLCRRQAVLDAGGMDTDYFLYSEDTDFCKRLWNKGWKVLIEPGLYIFHKKDPLGGGRRRENFFLTHRNILLFLKKNDSQLNYYLARLVLMLGLTLRFFLLPLLLGKGKKYFADSFFSYLRVFKVLISGI